MFTNKTLPSIDWSRLFGTFVCETSVVKVIVIYYFIRKIFCSLCPIYGYFSHPNLSVNAVFISTCAMALKMYFAIWLRLIMRSSACTMSLHLPLEPRNLLYVTFK